MVVNLNGFLADSAWTYAVGEVDEAGKKLMDVTKNTLPRNRAAQVGNRW